MCDNFHMMENVALFQRLQSAAEAWRAEGWPCEEEPLIAEILRWQFASNPDDKTLKFLRWPQFQALEVYWMLRLKYGTPHIMDIYKKMFADNLGEFVRALGLPLAPQDLKWGDPTADSILKNIREDDELVREKQLDALREAAILPYPSYIFALAMGAGKTILIASIIATEFAMALRRPERGFMQNALVFAPGKTIMGSLREIAAAPYDKILPPDFYRLFDSNARIVYPRDGEPEIQIKARSAGNIIVTNTEKIILRASARNGGNSLSYARTRNGELKSNLRLQKIASLPNLGVFSDEAHHTYGNDLGKELKRVRETVNHIAEKTRIVAVVNTTGTPYRKRNKPLTEVVSWYGLAEGIRDNILKRIDEIPVYTMGKGRDSEAIADIISDFFQRYGDVALPDGAKAKIAFYFKRQDHLDECRKIIAREMTKIGKDPAHILVNTQKSKPDEIQEFNNLKKPNSQKRVILLVAKGVEGWDCPSLFASALIKEQSSSVFILQAAARCLRQIPGNDFPARIYLDSANYKCLDNELRDNFGANILDFQREAPAAREVVIRVRRVDFPPLEIVRHRRRVTRALPVFKKIKLRRPEPAEAPEIQLDHFTPNLTGASLELINTGKTISLRPTFDCVSPATAAARIASRLQIPALPLLAEIQRLYPKNNVPVHDLQGLGRQVEKRTARYETEEEREVEALSLIHIADKNGKILFREDAGGFYHVLRYSEKSYAEMRDNGRFAEPKGEKTEPASHEIDDPRGLSFHYAPYNFDSAPERKFFEEVITALNLNPRDIRCFLFTGGLPDSARTDFSFEYEGEDKRFHRYFPDFVIVRKTGEFLVVEIKARNEENHPTVQAKARAVRALEKLQPGKLRYHTIFSEAAALSLQELKPVWRWINEEESPEKNRK